MMLSLTDRRPSFAQRRERIERLSARYVDELLRLTEEHGINPATYIYYDDEIELLRLAVAPLYQQRRPPVRREDAHRRHEAFVGTLAEHAVEIAAQSAILRKLSTALALNSPRQEHQEHAKATVDVCYQWRKALLETTAQHLAALIDLASAHGGDLFAYIEEEDREEINATLEVLRDREGTS